MNHVSAAHAVPGLLAADLNAQCPGNPISLDAEVARKYKGTDEETAHPLIGADPVVTPHRQAAGRRLAWAPDPRDQSASTAATLSYTRPNQDEAADWRWR
jgi:hypothetical protein